MLVFYYFYYDIAGFCLSVLERNVSRIFFVLFQNIFIDFKIEAMFLYLVSPPPPPL